MKSAIAGEQANAAGMGACKLDRCLDPFASRTRKEYFLKAATCQFAKPRSEFSSELWNIALEHHRAIPFKFLDESADNGWMVVPHIMDAIAGKKIGDPPSVVGK